MAMNKIIPNAPVPPIPEHMLREAEEEGRRACWNGIWRNPYLSKGPLAGAWDKGWQDADFKGEWEWNVIKLPDGTRNLKKDYNA